MDKAIWSKYKYTRCFAIIIFLIFLTACSSGSTANSNSKSIIVGDEGTILISNNDLDWKTEASSTSSNLLDITYGNHRFVVVGAAGIILTSLDGIRWTQQSYITHEDLNGISYGNNQFVVVGNSGTILTSIDGIRWNSQSSGTSNNLMGIIYTTSNYVAFGAVETLLVSVDGVTWRLQLDDAIGVKTLSSPSPNLHRGLVCVSEMLGQPPYCAS